MSEPAQQDTKSDPAVDPPSQDNGPISKRFANRLLFWLILVPTVGCMWLAYTGMRGGIWIGLYSLIGTICTALLWVNLSRLLRGEPDLFQSLADRKRLEAKLPRKGYVHAPYAEEMYEKIEQRKHNE